jgi:hypothetical protein
MYYKLDFNMLESKFRQIYVNLNDGKWYVTNRFANSGLMSLMVDVQTPASSWYVVHNRNTTKIFIQTLNSAKSELIPQTIKFVDANTIQINFDTDVAGTLHLILTNDEFYDI